jgi:riboflavin synthase
MFTGLIAATGKVTSLSGSATPQLTVETDLARELKTGDSVAVSGVCLTALDIRDDSFAADLAQETLRRTNLQHLVPGATVNLELPARADSRLDGHIVQGHVDGQAKLISLKKTSGDDWLLNLQLSEGLESGVVPKGSITVEGISLTVASIDGRIVQIAIIPHTYEMTNLRTLKPGAVLNIELDVLAKYAAKAQESRFTVDELIALGF